MAERKLRWGLLSTARINERLIPAIRAAQRSELVGVASRNTDKAQQYARAQGIPRAYGSYEAMLADREIDAIYLSLPNGLHCEWSVKAAKAGKHILCEKPIAVTVAEVDRMTEAARRSGVVLQEAAMYRYHPQTRRLKELINEGAIGEIRSIQSYFCFTLMNPGDVRLDPELAGGALWDIGSYPVSFMRTMIGANPVEVFAWQVASERGVDLTLAGQMRFAGEATGQFYCSFQAVPYWEAEIIGSVGRMHVDEPWQNIIGKPGRVYMLRDSGVRGKTTFGDSTEHLLEESATFPGNAYDDEVATMEACILDGAPPVISLEDSRGNVATINALLASAREKRVVQVSEFWGG